MPDSFRDCRAVGFALRLAPEPLISRVLSRVRPRLDSSIYLVCRNACLANQAVSLTTLASLFSLSSTRGTYSARGATLEIHPYQSSSQYSRKPRLVSPASALPLIAKPRRILVATVLLFPPDFRGARLRGACVW